MAIARAEKDLERVQKRSKALSMALERVRADIAAVVEKNAEAWGEEAAELVEKKLFEVERAVEASRRLRLRSTRPVRCASG